MHVDLKRSRQAGTNGKPVRKLLPHGLSYLLEHHILDFIRLSRNFWESLSPGQKKGPPAAIPPAAVGMAAGGMASALRRRLLLKRPQAGNFPLRQRD